MEADKKLMEHGIAGVMTKDAGGDADVRSRKAIAGCIAVLGPAVLAARVFTSAVFACAIGARYPERAPPTDRTPMLPGLVGAVRALLEAAGVDKVLPRDFVVDTAASTLAAARRASAGILRSLACLVPLRRFVLGFLQAADMPSAVRAAVRDAVTAAPVAEVAATRPAPAPAAAAPPPVPAAVAPAAEAAPPPPSPMEISAGEESEGGEESEEEGESGEESEGSEGGVVWRPANWRPVDLAAAPEPEVDAAEALGLGAAEAHRHVYLFQLPSELPAVPGRGVAGGGGDAGASTSAGPAVGAPLRAFTGTRLGRLLVFRSGRVKLQVGETLLDVSPGVPVTRANEVAVYRPSDGGGGGGGGSEAPRDELVLMGAVTRRAVVTPDVLELLGLRAPPSLDGLEAALAAAALREAAADAADAAAGAADAAAGARP